MYFCICSEIRYGQKWIIARCGISELRSLIEENTDILSGFLTSKKVIVITMDLQGNETSCIMDVDDADRLDLSKEGIYVRGYMRPMVTDVTDSSRFPEYNLPFVNFND